MISLKPVSSTIDLCQVFADSAPPRLRLHFGARAEVPKGMMPMLSALLKSERPNHRSKDGTYIIRDFCALSRVLNGVGSAVIPNLLYRLQLGIAEGRYGLDASIVKDIEAASRQIEVIREDLRDALGIESIAPFHPGAKR